MATATVLATHTNNRVNDSNSNTNWLGSACRETLMANDCSDCVFWQRRTYDPDGDHLGRAQAEVECWGVCLQALGPQHREGYFTDPYFVQNCSDHDQVVFVRSCGAVDEPPFFVEDRARDEAWLITKETFSCSEHLVVS